MPTTIEPLKQKPKKILPTIMEYQQRTYGHLSEYRMQAATRIFQLFSNSHKTNVDSPKKSKVQNDSPFPNPNESNSPRASTIHSMVINYAIAPKK